MNLRFTSLVIFAFLFSGPSIFAQLNKNVIVEHFTNTRCSICANSNKNPALRTNLEAHPEVLHISYHPSSPYSNCELSLHNPSENDGRTNYYNIYGATPRLIVQGKLNPNSIAFGSPDVFTQYLNQAPEVAIVMEQTKVTDASIQVTITITSLTDNVYNNPRILVAVAEKLLNYAAPNGEQEHHNVFRKAMTDITGDAIALPAMGESISLDFSVDHNADWDFSQMFTYVIINDGDSKEVIAAYAASPDDTPSSLKENSLTNLSIYPNPVSNQLTIDLESEEQSTALLFDVQGKLLLSQDFRVQTQLDLSDFAKGIYFLEVKNEEGIGREKLIRQ